MKKDDIQLSYLTNKRDLSLTFSRELFTFDSQKCKGAKNSKYLLVMAYLRRHVSMMGDLTFTLNHLISYCGYSTKSNNGTIKSHFVAALMRLADDGFITCDCDLTKVTCSQNIHLELSRDKNIFFNEDNFVFFDMEEFDTIVSTDIKSNKCIALLVFLAIKQYIYYNMRTGNKKSIAFPSKRTLQGHTGISISTIEKAIDDLVDIKVLYRKRNLFMPDSYQPNIYVPAKNIYALSLNAFDENCLKYYASEIGVSAVYEKSQLPDNAEIKFIQTKGGNKN